ncbi:hypothetical protein [Microbispora sp. H10670]|uniref:hypothetical protein n=1 Tax=Microbispora sp. H10670 TaxID=2729108 RepID=UPI001600328E|nr:hypothetical protein [Microbispora sp. H10670]
MTPRAGRSRFRVQSHPWLSSSYEGLPPAANTRSSSGTLARSITAGALFVLGAGSYVHEDRLS